MNSNKKKARVAGFLFLIVIVCGVFAEFFVRQKIIVQGDPVATANNISTHEFLFQVGIVSDLMMATAYLFFGIVAYFLLKSVNINHAQVMLLCIVVSVTILCVNMLNMVAALNVMSGDDYLKSFEKDHLQALATFFLKLHSKGYGIAQIFYGLYLFPLGYLIYKSGFLPKIIGVFLMLGCFGDLIDFFRFFLFPDYQSIILQNITLPANIGEFSLCLWLLIKGVKTTEVKS